MSAASDWEATRRLRRKKPIQVSKKTMLLDIDCTNLDCRYSYMKLFEVEGDYPKTEKCPKCGREAKVTRRR